MIGFRICTGIRRCPSHLSSPLTTLFPLLNSSATNADLLASRSFSESQREARQDACLAIEQGADRPLVPFPLSFASAIPIVRLPSCDD
jgi:hypothetical protein